MAWLIFYDGRQIDTTLFFRLIYWILLLWVARIQISAGMSSSMSSRPKIKWASKMVTRSISMPWSGITAAIPKLMIKLIVESTVALSSDGIRLL